jgi:hypothetical protein
MKISIESVKCQGTVPQKPLSEIPQNTVIFTLRFKIGEISVCTEGYCCLKKILSAKLNTLIPAK